MPRLREVLTALEQIAPARFAFAFDKVGLQVGDPDQWIERAVVSMDGSLAAVRYGKEIGAQLLLSHHPLIFNPISAVTAKNYSGKVILSLAKEGISFIAAHTNWDSARGGINDTLCEMFELKQVKDFESGADVSRLKVVTFALESDVEAIIDAASSAGAGVIGAYKRCASLSLGTGTFYPGEGTNPTVGNIGQTETVDEIRIEIVLGESQKGAVERAIRRAHSYEEPAIDFFSLATAVEQPAGRIGILDEPTTLSELSARVASVVGLATWTWGLPDRPINKVAFVGGAADGEWMAAQRAGADVLVTGEVKQHVALEATESGFSLIAAGHYATENPGCSSLKARMAAAVPDVEWFHFEPEPGTSGRPY